MRITYFYGENLAGIKVGCKLDKIEIDFSNNKNKFILLSGENGAGKSTLLSLLHPLRDTNDDRKTVFDKEKAKKIVRFVTKNGDEYEALHTWNPNKSFLYKNGECLNDNGSIKQFEALIKEECNLGTDYFKIGRIGSNVKNFIDFQPSERKSYISNYLDYIDDYLKKFTIVKNKYTMMKKELTNIGNQLDKLPELDDIKERLKFLLDTISKIQKSIKKKEKELTELSVKEKLDKQAMDDLFHEFEQEYGLTKEILNSYDTIVKELESYENELKSVNESLDLPDDKFNKKLNSITKKISDKEKDIAVESTKLSELNKSLDKLNKELSIESASSREDVDSEIKYTEENISSINEEIKTLESELPDDLDYSIFEDLDSETNNDLIENATKLFNEFYTRFENTVNLYGDIFKSPLNATSTEKLNAKLNSIKEDLEKVSEDLSYIKHNSQLLDILDNRPETCSDDSCSFIKEAYNYKTNYYDKQDEFNKKYQNLFAKSIDLEAKIEASNRIDEKNRCIKDTKEAFNDYISFMKESGIIDFINYTPVKDFIDLLESNISEVYKDYNPTGVRYIFYKYSNLKNKEENVKLLEGNLKQLKEFKRLNSKVLKKINKLKKSIDETVAEIEESAELLKDMNIELNTLKKKEKYLNSVKTVKELYNENKEWIEIISKYLNRSTDLEASIEENQSKIDSLEEELNGLNETLQVNQSESEKIMKDKNYIEILLDKKENLDKDYKYTTLIKDSLDPKKGIPLIFIKEFFSNIVESTNRLLDIAYKGNFSIDFDITDKSFTIPTYVNGFELEDITLASQGETALTSLSLYLAMIENIITSSNTTKEDYNIVYFDEVDGALSTQNRRIFFSMANEQIETLGIEQVFDITHNNEFYSSPVDLIILDNSDINRNDENFLMDKNIIFDINEYRKNI